MAASRKIWLSSGAPRGIHDVPVTWPDQARARTIITPKFPLNASYSQKNTSKNEKKIHDFYNHRTLLIITIHIVVKIVCQEYSRKMSLLVI